MIVTNNIEGVPEPITLSLFGAGLVGAAALRRRKKSTA
ncbi:MAG: PEP-CTERM sorting domain-containing protein [Rhizomicrobium sp.]